MTQGVFEVVGRLCFLVALLCPAYLHAQDWPLRDRQSGAKPLKSIVVNDQETPAYVSVVNPTTAISNDDSAPVPVRIVSANEAAQDPTTVEYRVVGVTGSTSDGRFNEGYAGPNRYCDFEFPGSRMCMVSEIRRSPVAAYGWVNGDHITETEESANIGNCLNWSSTSAKGWGIEIGTPPSLDLLDCSVSRQIVCCAPVRVSVRDQ